MVIRLFLSDIDSVYTNNYTKKEEKTCPHISRSSTAVFGNFGLCKKKKRLTKQ